MSSELKVMLSKVAVEDNVRKELEFEEGINRYKSLLLRVAKVQPFDVLVSSEGTEQGNLNQKYDRFGGARKSPLIKRTNKRDESQRVPPIRTYRRRSRINKKALERNHERQRASSASHVGSAVISRDTGERNRTKPNSLSSLRQNLQDQLRDGETQRYNSP